MRFEFLKSNRFWALVGTGFVIMAEGSFTEEAVIKGLVTILGGFVAVRTVDRFSEKVSAK